MREALDRARSRALGRGRLHPAAGRRWPPAARWAACWCGYCALTALPPDLPSLFDDDYGPARQPGPHRGRTRQQRAGAGPLRQAPARPGDAGGAPPGQAARSGSTMRRTLDDPVWGALTPALAGERVEYFVEYDGGRSPRFRIQVFHRPGGGAHRRPHRVPAPARAARQGRRRRPLPVGGRGGAGDRHRPPDTRPPARCALQVPPGRAGAAGRSLTAAQGPRVLGRAHARPAPAATTCWSATRTAARTRRPPRLSIEVHRNQPPQIALSLPRQGRAGLAAGGADGRGQASATTWRCWPTASATGWPGARRGRSGWAARPAGKPQPSVTARATIALEDLGAQPDELLTYHFWAEDRDGSGKLRRTSSDMYFAEVRPFEERFRERSADGQEGERERRRGRPDGRQGPPPEGRS